MQAHTVVCVRSCSLAPHGIGIISILPQAEALGIEFHPEARNIVVQPPAVLSGMARNPVNLRMNALPA